MTGGDTDLESGAGVAVWSSETRVAQAPLVQAVSVAATVSLAGRSNVEVLHSPLGVGVLLVEPEPDRAEGGTRGQETVTDLDHQSWNKIQRGLVRESSILLLLTQLMRCFIATWQHFDLIYLKNNRSKNRIDKFE